MDLSEILVDNQLAQRYDAGAGGRRDCQLRPVP